VRELDFPVSPIYKGNREQGTGNREQIKNKSCTSLKLSQKKDVF
jgi:hypothetical protein